MPIHRSGGVGVPPSPLALNVTKYIGPAGVNFNFNSNFILTFDNNVWTDTIRKEKANISFFF